MNYAKAPYFENVFPLIQKCLRFNTNLIIDLAINSVREVAKDIGERVLFLPLYPRLSNVSRGVIVKNVN